MLVRIFFIEIQLRHKVITDTISFMYWTFYLFIYFSIYCFQVFYSFLLRLCPRERIIRDYFRSWVFVFTISKKLNIFVCQRNSGIYQFVKYLLKYLLESSSLNFKFCHVMFDMNWYQCSWYKYELINTFFSINLILL